MERYANERSHLRYMQSLEASRLPDAERIEMKADDWLEERVITGLRMDEGILVDGWTLGLVKLQSAWLRADCYMSPMVVGLHPSKEEGCWIPS